MIELEALVNPACKELLCVDATGSLVAAGDSGGRLSVWDDRVAPGSCVLQSDALCAAPRDGSVGVDGTPCPP